MNLNLAIGSLFSGIGGLELGLERAGIGRTVWQAESDPFARAILARHWRVQCYRDVRDVRVKTSSPVGVICGGFPCQDLSVAGKGAGIHGARSGLWFEFARIVDEHQPLLVVVENVTHGQGRWLPTVLGDLGDLGYVPAAITVPAGAVGAPHVRARTFVVADTDGLVLRLLEQRDPARRSARGVRDERQGEPVDDGEAGRPSLASAWTTGPALDGVGDGLPGGVDGADQRANRLRVLGNAVVPQVAEAIGRLIIEAHFPASAA